METMTEGAAVAGKTLQGSSGTQRNSKDGVNVYEFTNKNYLPQSLLLSSPK